ncbi:ComC/BlpC family leader-containing pheromone/bacteriocin [Streptococcus sanguinis]|nr:ComC/BlpC family leader-containing pheromone/bacteriocin [Streptococcus sanguinis]MCC3172109.1 bacteriocin-type signal sequence domain protein [Streptococcus sanguinis]
MNKKKLFKQFNALSPEELENISGGGQNWLRGISNWFEAVFGR